MSDFWSRRKQAVEQAEVAETQTEIAAREATEQAELEEAQAQMSEAELLESLGLPDPDLARSGDDIAAFMVKAVPRHIRNRALRSLWRSNPVLACVDGLNDYDGDFTGNGLKGGVLKTSYQVGKGLTAHVEKMAREAEIEAKKAGEPELNPLSDKKNQEPSADLTTENLLAETDHEVESTPMDTAAEEAVGPPVVPSARMRFTFEEDDPE